MVWVWWLGVYKASRWYRRHYNRQYVTATVAVGLPLVHHLF